MTNEKAQTIGRDEIISLIRNTRLSIPSRMPIILKAKYFSIRISASTGQITVTTQRGKLDIDGKIAGKRIMLTRPGASIAAASLTLRPNGSASLTRPPLGDFILTVV